MLRLLRPCSPILLAGVCLLGGRAVRAGEIPADLPHYDLAIRIDTNTHCVQVRERVTWTNTHQRPADELVFCVYPHYKIPDKDFAAKWPAVQATIRGNELVSAEAIAARLDRFADWRERWLRDYFLEVQSGGSDFSLSPAQLA